MGSRLQGTFCPFSCGDSGNVSSLASVFLPLSARRQNLSVPSSHSGGVGGHLCSLYTEHVLSPQAAGRLLEPDNYRPREALPASHQLDCGVWSPSQLTTWAVAAPACELSCLALFFSTNVLQIDLS